MPRIHYPKGCGTSSGSWADDRPALPLPAAGCPFFTKAHKTLTGRPGESSSQFPVYVAGRPTTGSPVPKGRFPSHGSLLPNLDLPGTLVVIAFSKVSVVRAFPRKRFSGHSTLCEAASPHVPGPVDDVTNHVSGCPSVPVPPHCPVRAYRRTSGPSARGPASSTASETRLAALPLTTSRGLRGILKAFPEGADDGWRNPVVRALRAL